MDSERLIALIQLYRLGNLTPGEADELFAFLEEDRVGGRPSRAGILIGGCGNRWRAQPGRHRSYPLAAHPRTDPGADKPIVQQQEKRPALIFGMRRWLAAVAAAAILIFLVGNSIKAIFPILQIKV